MAHGSGGRESEYVETLARGISVLEQFSLASPELGLSELARRTGLSKHTVHRMLNTLESMEILTKDPVTRSYRLAPGTLNLGFTVLESKDLGSTAHPFLVDLARRTGEFVSLAVLDGVEIVMVETVRSVTSPIGVHMHSGSREDAHLSSHGKVLLAALAEPMVRKHYPDGKLRAPAVGATPDLNTLLRDLDGVRRRGYGVNDQETSAGVRSVAVSVRGRDGDVIGSMNIAVPVARMSLGQLTRDLLPEIRQTAAELSAALGYDESV